MKMNALRIMYVLIYGSHLKVVSIVKNVSSFSR